MADARRIWRKRGAGKFARKFKDYFELKVPKKSRTFPEVFMKRQHRIASIVSTMLMVVSFLSQPLLGQQSASQSPAQQPAETAQQPQSNQTAPAQPNTAPANTSAPANAQPSSPNNPSQQQTQQPQQQPSSSGTTVNPSQAPLQPVTTYPNANETQQAEEPIAAPAQATTVPEGPKPKKPAEPVGAAAAESVPTAGGAAAKPAGVAIAPAKQHQTRSLLIKVGAALAAGAAIGTVFALSKGTSSTPPGAGAPGVTQK